MSVLSRGFMASSLAVVFNQTLWAAEPAPTDTNTPPTAQVASTPRLEDSQRLLHLVGTGGLSLGGDTIATAYYSNGDSEDLKAGGLVYFSGGLGVDIPNVPITLQVLAGVHINDTSSADNGSLKFTRSTLDAQVFYRQGNHRFGIGVVQHSGIEYVGKIDGQPDDRAEFEDSNGFSVEYNYLPASFNWPWQNSRAGFSLRYIKIDYTPSSYNGVTIVNPKTFDGSHLAAGIYFYL